MYREGHLSSQSQIYYLKKVLSAAFIKPIIKIEPQLNAVSNLIICCLSESYINQIPIKPKEKSFENLFFS